MRPWLGDLLEDGVEFRETDGVPRFVEDDAYAASFGDQWNWFSKVQLDRQATGQRESYETFVDKTGVRPEQLEGKTVLDVGCGMGRFADVVSAAGARVVGFDLSRAVDAAQENLGQRENVAIVQADVFALPFRPEAFDFVYSIGVLHHTPDTRAAFDCLPRLLKPGGTLAIWVYSGERAARRYTRISDLYRRWTTKMDRDRLLRVCRRLEPLGRFYRTRVGRLFIPLLPVSAHPDPEWRVLDTFDWYSPRYQWKHTWAEVEGWFREAGLAGIRRSRFPVSVAGDRKPAA
jgi:SAM-dependent methyltransferase